MWEQTFHSGFRNLWVLTGVVTCVLGICCKKAQLKIRPFLCEFQEACPPCVFLGSLQVLGLLLSQSKKHACHQANWQQC